MAYILSANWGSDIGLSWRVDDCIMRFASFQLAEYSPCCLLIALLNTMFCGDNARPKNVFVGVVTVVCLCEIGHCEVEATDMWRLEVRRNASHADDCSSKDAIPKGANNFKLFFFRSLIQSRLNKTRGRLVVGWL